MVLAIAILVTCVGAICAVWGLRGRRYADDAPRCRRCGYDLRATTAERCPECGALLAGRRAVRRGRVWRRPGWIGVGVLLAIVGVATVGLGRGGLLTERTLDRLTPTAYLVWRMDRDRGPTLTADVWQTVQRQYHDPERVTEAQRQHILARLVAIHGDASLPWIDAWNEVIENAYLEGSLPPALTEAYVERLADAVSAEIAVPTLEVGRLYRPDFAIAPSRHRDLNGGTMFGGGAREPTWAADDLRYVLRLDGEVVADSRRFMPGGDGFVFARSTPGKFMPFPASHRVPRDFAQRHTLGPCELEIEMHFDVIDAGRRDRGTLGSAVRVVRLPVSIALPSTTEPSE